VIKIQIKKIKKKIPIFLTFLIISISLSFVAIDGSGCNNGPNYWGDSYPGHLVSEYYYQHPNEPSEYIFGRAEPLPNSNGYDGSHYGTHDWIADAVLRSIRDLIKNPLGFSDWAWLINSETARNRWPAWKPYISPTNHHEIVRSYMTFLFATQMPDMRRDSGYPQRINIPTESVIIEDFHPQTKNINKWVGQIQQHTFHFMVVDTVEGIKGFAPYKTLSAIKAKQLGEAAIKCIGNKVKDEQGVYQSAMQPEGAAGWLGAMTHYIVDLVSPGHLLEHKEYKEVYSSQYHSWFEDQLASLTKWNKGDGAHGGPEIQYFSWDIAKIGMTGLIIPIRPDLAVTSMAWNAIEIAYRKDGNHQHIELSGNNDEEAKNSGLYLSNSDNHWDWKEDLDENGRAGSPHKYFYDKVEKLLCLSTFFTACAMQYCFNEGKKDSEQGLNPDYWIREPNDDVPSQDPDPNPGDSLNELEGESRDSFTDRMSRLFRDLGISASLILIAIAQMLRKSFYLIGR